MRRQFNMHRRRRMLAPSAVVPRHHAVHHARPVATARVAVARRLAVPIQPAALPNVASRPSLIRAMRIAPRPMFMDAVMIKAVAIIHAAQRSQMAASNS